MELENCIYEPIGLQVTISSESQDSASMKNNKCSKELLGIPRHSTKLTWKECQDRILDLPSYDMFDTSVKTYSDSLFTPHSKTCNIKAQNLISEGIFQKRTFTCDQCGKSFSLKEYLQHHEKFSHYVQAYQYNSCLCRPKSNCKKQDKLSNQTKFFCKYCEKSFISLADQRKHEMTHDHIKHFECSVCSFSSKYKHSINRHYKIFHNK